MRIVEFRIFLPLPYDKCSIASRYAVHKRVSEGKKSNDQIRTIATRDVTIDGKKAREVHRQMHIRSKIPFTLRWAVPEKYDVVDEFNIDSFPAFKSRFELPGMGSNFTLETETMHFQHADKMSIPENYFNLSEEDLQKREIRYLDVLGSDCSLGGLSIPELGINNLPDVKASGENEIPMWVTSYIGPLTLVIKLARIDFHVRMHSAQSAIEHVVVEKGFHSEFLNLYKSMLLTAHEWSSLTNEDFRSIECD